MGSGCNSNCSNLFGEPTLDKQVKYTGPAIPELGICTGDYLDEVDSVILQKIIDYSHGIGISIPSIDLTTCEAFADCIGCCSNCTDLPCLLQCYKDTICEIWDLIKDLKGPYTTMCLTGVNSNSTLKAIVQQLIVQFCQLVTTVTNMQTQINSLQTQINNINNNLPINIGNFLLNSISSCQGSSAVKETGTGATAQISIQGVVPIGAIIPYAGNTAGKFDSSGLGIAGTDACGYALANGNSHTVGGITYTTEDMRELVPVGAGAGVMGGGALPSNASGANYGFNALVGQAFVTLTANQSGLVGHSHGWKTQPHSHRMHGYAKSANDNNNLGGSHPDDYFGLSSDSGFASRYPYQGPQGSNTGTQVYAYIDECPSWSSDASGSYNGGLVIEIYNTGDQNAKEAHENRQPSRALLYIQRIY